MKKILIVCIVLLVAPAARGAIDFEKQILPIFEANCIKCHGAEKGQGKLVLISVEGIKAKMDSDDHLLVPGHAEKSELYQRLTLPTDDKKRMPKGADPLDKASLDLIAAWIKEGAAFTIATVEPGSQASETSTEPPKEDNREPQVEPLPLPELSAPSQEAIDKLVAAGAQVMPLFAESHLLDISFALSPHPPTDETLAMLQDVAQQVISLNLKNTKATEEGWKVLSRLENLTNLNVQNSSFTDSAAHHLSGLARLESLNLYGTQVTDAALEPLESLKRLQKLYLWKTKVTYDAAVALEKDIPGIEWNLGWDHPVIARKRLETQKSEFAELVKKADAETARLKGELQVSEEAKSTAAKRLKEVEDSLAKLEEDEPSEPKSDSSKTN